MNLFQSLTQYALLEDQRAGAQAKVRAMFLLDGPIRTVRLEQPRQCDRCSREQLGPCGRWVRDCGRRQKCAARGVEC